MCYSYQLIPSCFFASRECKTAERRSYAIWGAMVVYAYIDGFNLYHGALRGTPYKWLNVSLLCAALFPKLTIDFIKYFTALVKPFPHDKSAPLRQKIYLKAVETIPNLEIHRGYFDLRSRVYPQYPFAYLKLNRPPLVVQIRKGEEKGTDVNIASHLLVDCFKKKFDEAIIISNDSDLILPIEMVKSDFGKKVHVINPHRSKQPNQRLIKAATSYQTPITNTMLASCQFPPQLTDAKGKQFTKPPSW